MRGSGHRSAHCRHAQETSDSECDFFRHHWANVAGRPCSGDAGSARVESLTSKQGLCDTHLWDTTRACTRAQVVSVCLAANRCRARDFRLLRHIMYIYIYIYVRFCIATNVSTRPTSHRDVLAHIVVIRSRTWLNMSSAQEQIFTHPRFAEKACDRLAWWKPKARTCQPFRLCLHTLASRKRKVCCESESEVALSRTCGVFLPLFHAVPCHTTGQSQSKMQWSRTSSDAGAEASQRALVLRHWLRWRRRSRSIAGWPIAGCSAAPSSEGVAPSETRA